MDKSPLFSKQLSSKAEAKQIRSKYEPDREKSTFLQKCRSFPYRRLSVGDWNCLLNGIAFFNSASATQKSHRADTFKVAQDDFAHSHEMMSMVDFSQSEFFSNWRGIIG